MDEAMIIMAVRNGVNGNLSPTSSFASRMAPQIFFLMMRRPPISTPYPTLFPYTTLFRALREAAEGHRPARADHGAVEVRQPRQDRKSTRLNSCHIQNARMPSSA